MQAAQETKHKMGPAADKIYLIHFNDVYNIESGDKVSNSTRTMDAREGLFSNKSPMDFVVWLKKLWVIRVFSVELSAHILSLLCTSLVLDFELISNFFHKKLRFKDIGVWYIT